MKKCISGDDVRGYWEAKKSERISTSHISKIIVEECYTNDDNWYLSILTWERHVRKGNQVHQFLMSFGEHENDR